MLIESLFSFKTQLLEMSKRKQVQCSLSSFFGGKQNQESNTTPAPPAATPIKKTRKFQESWKEKYRDIATMPVTGKNYNCNTLIIVAMYH